MRVSGYIDCTWLWDVVPLVVLDGIPSSMNGHVTWIVRSVPASFNLQRWGEKGVQLFYFFKVSNETYFTKSRQSNSIYIRRNNLLCNCTYILSYLSETNISISCSVSEVRLTCRFRAECGMWVRGIEGDVVKGSSYPYTSSSKYPRSKQNQDNSNNL